MKIGDKFVGNCHPTYIVAEIGLNHNGDMDIAKKLIDSAVYAGCDAVKFQKRTPELCVPESQRNVMRETPWGYITYMEYRYRVEFDEAQYHEIDDHCREIGIEWFASCWDKEALQFIGKFEPPALKIPSACLTDHDLLSQYRKIGCSIILSTGMSTMEQIRDAVHVLGQDNLILTHCTSTYPCPPSELNLRMIRTLKSEFNCPIGYSGHEVGLPPSIAAVAIGACVVERHITLDRSMWGSDQSASVEPGGLRRLVKYIRTVEAAMGDGVKKIYEGEKPILSKLRRIV